MTSSLVRWSHKEKGRNRPPTPGPRCYFQSQEFHFVATPLCFMCLKFSFSSMCALTCFVLLTASCTLTRKRPLVRSQHRAPKDPRSAGRSGDRARSVLQVGEGQAGSFEPSPEQSEQLLVLVDDVPRQLSLLDDRLLALGRFVTVAALPHRGGAHRFPSE